jgi:hypothetical protein
VIHRHTGRPAIDRTDSTAAASNLEGTMSNVMLIIVWIACVILGAIAGFAAGYLLWKLGFELIGSAVALVGAGVGGIAAFLWFLQWSEDRRA